MELLFLLGISLPLFIIGLIFGTITERNHFVALRRRESELAGIVTCLFAP